MKQITCLSLRSLAIMAMFFALFLLHTGCKCVSRPAALIDGRSTVIACEKKFQKVADDLALHLKEITGETIPVNPEQPLPPGTYTLRILQTPEGVDASSLKPEEARWHFGPMEAVFYGEGNFGPRHAVYAFLEDELGVRWPTPNDIVCHKTPIISLDKADGVWIPKLLSREIRPGNGKFLDKDAQLWFERLRWGYHNTPPFGHAFTAWWKKYGKEHPDYFAMVNGRRYPVSSTGEYREDVTAFFDQDARMISLCPSNPAVAKQIVANWDKKSAYINICENDSPAHNACHCDKCLALDPHPSQKLDNFMCADRYIFLANEVLKEARKYKPDVKVSMYAYNASQQPSVNIKMDPSIVLGIVPTDFRLSALQEYINGWRQSGMMEFKYRPNRHWYYPPMGYPIGNARHFFDVFQFMYKSGATNFDYDAPSKKFDFFRYYNDYILMQAMKDPDKPFEYWENDFVQSYAGDAAADLLDYLHFWTVLWDTKINPNLDKLANLGNWHNFSRQFAKETDQYYAQEDFTKSLAFLNKALKRSSLTAEQRKRLEDLKTFTEHAALMRQALSTRKRSDIQAIRDFRKAHGMPEIMQYEYDLGDYIGVRIDMLQEFAEPVIDLPIFWHFKLDKERKGENQNLQSATDFSKWDGLMPTDGPWENPKQSHPHPTPEIREKCKGYDGVAWYACEFEVPADWKDKRQVFAYFGAVDESADVWLNGKKVGSHPFIQPSDWETPFHMDITNFIDWSQKKQILTVKVTDNLGAGGIWKPCF
ncbi:MAG: DUF4838 domain-containing protein, partial [Victivallales bacterium]|nr:DUF4838 domain-containing protein [Victivallales bacterium]